MQDLEFTLDDLFQEVLARRQTQGAMSHDDYIDLVDEVMEEHREQGQLDDDYDSNQARVDLLARWEEVAESDDKEARGTNSTDEEDEY